MAAEFHVLAVWRIKGRVRADTRDREHARDVLVAVDPEWTAIEVAEIAEAALLLGWSSTPHKAWVDHVEKTDTSVRAYH